MLLSSIRNNPVKDNFVSKLEHWLYSFTSNYIEGKGILEEVFCLPPMQQLVRRKGVHLIKSAAAQLLRGLGNFNRIIQNNYISK